MRLALLQTSATRGDPTGALARLRSALEAAARAGAHMLLVPELLLPGYNAPEAHAREAQSLDGAWIAELSALARAAGCGVTLGWAERLGDSRFNAATAIGPDGAILAHYRKIQLYGAMERASFSAGNEPPPLFALGERLCGLLICYDVEFSHHAADLARRGADLVLVPTANPQGFDHVARILVPARAYESRLTIAYANYCGPDGDLAFGGLSVIVGPDGEPVAAAGRGPALLIVDLPAPQDYPQERLSTQAADLRRVDAPSDALHR